MAALEATMVAFEKNQQALEHKVDAGFTSMTAKLDALDSKLSRFHTDSDSRFVTLTDFKSFKEDVTLQLGRRWINNTLAAILGSVLTGLVSAVWFFVTQQ